MKTIEYPIKELVSFRMDENKIWWLKYHWSNTEPLSRKQCREYDYEIHKFCEEDNNFVIIPVSYYVNSGSPLLPLLIFPKGILGDLGQPFYSLGNQKVILNDIGFRKSYPNQLSPSPYYGNPHYKKYIEDNNGECPLPFPKDMK